MKKVQLKKQILEKELQIKKLSQHLNNSDACESLYNSLILEKAILKKELENLSSSKTWNLIKNICKPFIKSEKLIVDYFKS